MKSSEYLNEKERKLGLNCLQEHGVKVTEKFQMNEGRK